AFYHAMDRGMLADVLTAGLAPVADSWYRPTDPLRAPLQTSIPQYPHDPARAQQLLGPAGWARGPDGVLTPQPSGGRVAGQPGGATPDPARVGPGGDDRRGDLAALLGRDQRPGPQRGERHPERRGPLPDLELLRMGQGGMSALCHPERSEGSVPRGTDASLRS